MKRKILLISISSIFHDGRVNTYIQKLKDLGYEIFVIGLRQEKKEARIEKGDFTNYKIVRRYIGDSKLGYFWFYSKFFFINFVLSTYLTFKNKIKVIHYNNSPNFIIFSCLIPKLLGSKFILDNHDLVPATVQSKFNNDFLYKLALIEQKLSMKFANQIICADHNQMDYLIKLDLKSKTITPILNIPSKSILISDNKNNPERNDNSFNIVYHGTISYRLGIDLILMAISLIKNELKSFKFHLIGMGDFLISAEKIVSDLKLSDYVIIYNKYIPYAELPSILSKMSAGIIGNRQELLSDYMLPVKLLEYVNFNLPVIAPRNKIISRYFTENMLCFYEPENIEEMSQKILQLYRNRDIGKQYALEAYKFTENYNYVTEMSKYENLLEILSPK